MKTLAEIRTERDELTERLIERSEAAMRRVCTIIGAVIVGLIFSIPFIMEILKEQMK